MQKPSWFLSATVHNLFSPKQGTTILIVEQNALATLKIADYAYVLEIGKVTMEGNSQELLNDDNLVSAYLGGKK